MANLRWQSTSARSPIRGTKLVIVGDSGVGKTTLLMRLYTGQFLDDVLATVGIGFFNYEGVYNTERQYLTVWDTSGRDHFKVTRLAAYGGARVALFLYDMGIHRTFDHLQLWRKEVTEVIGKVPCIVIGSKADTERHVSGVEARGLAAEWNAPFIETSSVTGKGTKELFELLAMLVTPSPHSPKA